MPKKKGSKKMSKISVDGIDIDDVVDSENIAAETASIPSISKESKPKETKSSENDYYLAIAHEKDTYQLITLETCSSAEFFECMSQLYPYMGDADPETVYESRRAKIRTLKHVLNFHSEMLRPLREAGQILKRETKILLN